MVGLSCSCIHGRLSLRQFIVVAIVEVFVCRLILSWANFDNHDDDGGADANTKFVERLTASGAHVCTTTTTTATSTMLSSSAKFLSVSLIITYLVLLVESPYRNSHSQVHGDEFCGHSIIGPSPSGHQLVKRAAPQRAGHSNTRNQENKANDSGAHLGAQTPRRRPRRQRFQLQDEQQQQLQQQQPLPPEHRGGPPSGTQNDADLVERPPTSRNQQRPVGQGRGRGENVATNAMRQDQDDPSQQNGTGSNEPRLKVIETAVFIDQALGNKFNGLSNGLVELNKLVLTIMNQVQYLFEYSSLQVPIKLKLVLIEHLKESERQLGLQMPSSERGDIDAYLSNFCNWQQNRLERETRLWWDHAILLSGLDLYKVTPAKNHSGVLGLAWVGGMCKGNYSCTINEASNFESAFVIAHEIGHSLGIMHDGQKNRCDPNTFIMSERTGAGKVHWSKCSNSYLNDSIQRNQLTCLDSEQNNQIDSLYDLTKLRSPGQVYAINEQCKLAFGSNYSSFTTQQAPFNAVCRELWCVSGTWAKAAHPALEGSSCGGTSSSSSGDNNAAGSGRYCREGKCVK